MIFSIINLKEFSPTVEQAIAQAEIELEIAKKQDIFAVKFIHGYGSHGRGGTICKAIKTQAKIWKNKRLVKDYLSGAEWHTQNSKSKLILQNCKDSILDEDLDHFNMGITIFIL